MLRYILLLGCVIAECLVSSGGQGVAPEFQSNAQAEPQHEAVIFKCPRHLTAQAVGTRCAADEQRGLLEKGRPDPRPQPLGILGLRRLHGDTETDRGREADTSQLQQGLSGPVYGGGTTCNATVKSGQSIYYYFTDVITMAVLTPTSGDADLFFETCSGMSLTRSTRAGIASDWTSLYNGSGVADCRRIRV